MDPQMSDQMFVEPSRWLQRSVVLHKELSVTFANGRLLHDHLKAATRWTLMPSPPLSIAPFEWMCRGQCSEALRSEWGHSKYALLGESESDDRAWRVTIGVNVGLVLSSVARLSSNRKGPTLVAFVTYQRNSDDSSGTVVHKIVEGEVDVCYRAADGTTVLCERADLAWGGGSNTAVIEMEAKRVLQTLYPSLEEEFLSRTPDQPFSLKPFKIDIGLTFTVREKRAFPFRRLPDVALQLVADHLSLLDVQHLSQAVPELRADLQNTPTLRICRAIRPYFHDIQNFFAVLSACGAIIGGSLPLSVLRPGDPHWEAADLDLVVEPFGSGGLHELLLAEGYVVDPERSSYLEYPEGAGISFGFYKYVRGEQSVDVCSPNYMSVDHFPLYARI